MEIHIILSSNLISIDILCYQKSHHFKIFKNLCKAHDAVSASGWLLVISISSLSLSLNSSKQIFEDIHLQKKRDLCESRIFQVKGY